MNSETKINTKINTPVGSDALFCVSCPSCGGVPYVSRDGRDYCEQCDGTGKIIEREQVTEMRLCELRFVGLRPGQLYRFTVDQNCPKCVEDAKPFAGESPQNA